MRARSPGPPVREGQPSKRFSGFTVGTRSMSLPSDADAASIAQQAIRAIANCRLPPSPPVFTVLYRFFEGGHAELTEALAHRIDDPALMTRAMIESLYAQHFASASAATDRSFADQLDDRIDHVRLIMDEQTQSGQDYSDKLEKAQKMLAQADSQQAIRTVHQLSQDTESMRQQIDRLQRRVDEAKKETTTLKSQLIQSQAAMMTDHLTGLGNRRFYEATLKRAIKDIDDGTKLAYLVLVDCDNFKSINDTFGHPFGDKVLQRIASLMRELKTEASIARLGGDEFAAFIRCDRVAEIERFTDQLRTRLSQQPIVSQKTGETLQQLSLSIGVAAIRSTDDAASWHERADRLMYQAKRLGGDRAVIER